MRGTNVEDENNILMNPTPQNGEEGERGREGDSNMRNR